MEKQYYIYAHINHLGEVIYIGKGSDYSKGTRAYNWTDRPYTKEEVEEVIILPMRYTDEMLAYEIERIITEHYKNLGQCKYNKGIGTKHSKNTKEIMSKKKIGYKHSEEWKKQHSETLKGKYTKEKNPMYGKHHSEETKKKLSEIHQGKNPHANKTEEEKEEWRRKISESKKGRFTGEENPRARKVKCIETGEIFDTVTQASKWGGTQRGSIAKQIRGELKSTGKHPITGEKLHWEYVD